MAQLKRHDWLEQGLHLLAEQGVDALTISMVCKHLGVTKGSFYHHFADHQTFLRSLLEYWEETYTAQFIAESDAGTTIEARLERLNQQVLSTFGDQENHIRAWAQADPMAREFQMRVDQRRLTYLMDLYSQLLADEDQARAMAHLAYTSLIGSSSLIPPLAREDYENMTSLFTQLINHLPRRTDL